MKPWASDVAEHIKHWENRLGTLHWWPHYVYHFTDVQNAASILKHGAIYSRKLATSKQLMKRDIASPGVIHATANKHKEFVRLYFRPKTPTQYSNEGIRPRSKLEHGSHCPIPVFFMFDASKVLTMDSAQFSNGNLAKAEVQCDSTLGFFNSIPFNKVFHNGWFSPEDRDEIIFHRNAEVLVPDQLNLDHLQEIACRSVAERETLLSMLTWEEAQHWKKIIRLREQGLFERKWTYVESVKAVDGVVWFQMNPNSRLKGPFTVDFDYVEDGSSMPQFLRVERESIDRIGVQVPGAFMGTVTLRLDDCLAYQGTVVFDDIPF